MFKLSFTYDPVADILTVEGVKYSGDLFRAFAFGATPPGQALRVVNKSEDGTVTIQRLIIGELKD
jgi:hypothetical protein